MKEIDLHKDIFTKSQLIETENKSIDYKKGYIQAEIDLIQILQRYSIKENFLKDLLECLQWIKENKYGK